MTVKNCFVNFVFFLLFIVCIIITLQVNKKFFEWVGEKCLEIMYNNYIHTAVELIRQL